MTKKRGERYIINETEFTVLDAPKNKPVTVDIKSKYGQSGKANVKIYPMNNRGSGTIHITKISKGEFAHVKIVAFKVVKFLLDNIISGKMISKDIEAMKRKSAVKIDTKKAGSNCEKCESRFDSDQDLEEHNRDNHEATKVACMLSGNDYDGKGNLKHHTESVHGTKQYNKCEFCERGFTTSHRYCS